MRQVCAGHAPGERCRMGVAYAQLTLENPRDAAIRPVQVRGLADSGSVYLCIPPHIAAELGLEEIERKTVYTTSCG